MPRTPPARTAKERRIRKDRARPVRQRTVAKSKPSKAALRKASKRILGEKKRRKRNRKRPKRAKKRKSNGSDFSANSPSGLRLGAQKTAQRYQPKSQAQSKFAPAPPPTGVLNTVASLTRHPIALTAQAFAQAAARSVQPSSSKSIAAEPAPDKAETTEMTVLRALTMGRKAYGKGHSPSIRI